jgi:hypothetical protein
VKINVAEVEALRKKERQDETHVFRKKERQDETHVF